MFVSEGRVATGAMVLSGLHCHLWPWLYPCLLSSTMSECVVLSQPGSVLVFLWHKLLPKTIYMTGVYAAACDHIGIEGPCHHQGLADLSGNHCHPGPC